MWRLHQFTLCPFSRAVRFALAEKGVVHELVDVRPWERDETLTRLNPAAQTPVLENGELVLADSQAILEYFDETVERAPLLGAAPAERAETRRLVAWFRERFWGEVTAPLLRERMYKRLVLRQMPDGPTIREAARACETHLQYLESLLLENRWLAGPTFGAADIHAAAQISVADYLAGVDWGGHSQARQWYQAIKSRPSFRVLLGERMEGIRPPAHYDDPDF
ncbi:MAG: glutathione S-transferase family protein [Sphingomonadaceae bacterium]|uniref:glutathione S-transferase family protein n=1 Tax=Thermaurantiacus sp. TaxID=2820283 RepID=UPI00298EFD3B|nr:glutathione S-transferase family protein [Thermaurantiacus sp.]MCS6986561.1 glutathione S-transferase family protein [Sphingomonadaceae bacterium]MDW8414178.1 glutathione S-transferase family protein [Thermaurantiacus sp.]